jgi:hypothetical protein
MLIASFGDGASSKLKAVKQLPFEVTVNRVVTQAPAKQLPDRANHLSLKVGLTQAGQFAESRSSTKTNPRNAVERLAVERTAPAPRCVRGAAHNEARILASLAPISSALLLLRPLSVGRFASLRFRPKNMANHILQLEAELQNIPEAAPKASRSFSVSEKLARYGLSALSGAEHLRLLVGNDSVAEALLRHFGSLKALSRASFKNFVNSFQKAKQRRLWLLSRSQMLRTPNMLSCFVGSVEYS